jgi:alpha-N-arabinofuranosidase
MTEPGGAAWKQTTFFPFALTSRLATGVALNVKLQSDSYDTSVYGTVPLVDAVATHDSEAAATAILLVNRSQTESVTVTMGIGALGDVRVDEAHTLSDEDVYAKNTLDDQERVGLCERVGHDRRSQPDHHAATRVLERRLPHCKHPAYRSGSVAARLTPAGL